MINKNTNMINDTFNSSISLKNVIITIFSSLILITLISMLYLQNKQIQDLILHINILQDQLNMFQSSLSDLKGLVHEKHLENELLKQMYTKSISLNSEMLKAQTERRELYIKTALIAVGCTTVIVLGYLFMGGLPNAFSLKAWLPASFVSYGKACGLLDPVDRYYKRHENTYWRVEIIDLGEDLKIFVKLPDSNDYYDAMVLLQNYLNNLVKAPSTVSDSANYLNMSVDPSTLMLSPYAVLPIVTDSATIASILDNVLPVL